MEFTVASGIVSDGLRVCGCGLCGFAMVNEGGMVGWKLCIFNSESFDEGG
jgi:hypothetical protein